MFKYPNLDNIEDIKVEDDSDALKISYQVTISQTNGYEGVHIQEKNLSHVVEFNTKNFGLKYF